MPVELLYFNAYYQDDAVVINWATASETNNDYFAIEYSANAQNWYFLTKINGAGNSKIKIDYTYKYNANNDNYYRLTQVDYNGKSEIFTSDIVYVSTHYLNKNINYDIYDINGRYLGNKAIKNLQHGIFLIKNDNEFKKIIH